MKPVTYIVDADQASRIELSGCMRNLGFPSRPFISGIDFIEELPELATGLVLIDVQNAGLNGFDVVESVARLKFASPVIAMATIADVEIAVAAMKRGAVDFLCKPVRPEALQAAIVSATEVLESRRLLFERADEDELSLRCLSSREHNVLEMLTDGKANKEIAAELNIAVRTVELHRANIVGKLKVANILTATALLVRHRTARRAHEARVRVAAGSH